MNRAQARRRTRKKIEGHQCVHADEASEVSRLAQGWHVEQEQVEPGELVCGPVKSLGTGPLSSWLE